MPQGSWKQPEARLSTTWHTLFYGPAPLQLAGRPSVPHTIERARRPAAIIYHILGTQHLEPRVIFLFRHVSYGDLFLTA